MIAEAEAWIEGFDLPTCDTYFDQSPEEKEVGSGDCIWRKSVPEFLKDAECEMCNRVRKPTLLEPYFRQCQKVIGYINQGLPVDPQTFGLRLRDYEIIMALKVAWRNVKERKNKNRGAKKFQHKGSPPSRRKG